MKSSRWGAALQHGAVLALTGGCLAVVLWGLEPAEVWATLAGARWWVVAPLLATYLVVHVLRSWRYQVLVDADVAFRRAFAVCAVGFLAVNVVPLRLGELVRPYLLVRDGCSAGRALAAVVVERLLDLLMLLGLLLLVALGLDLPDGRVVVAGVDVVLAGQRAVGVSLTLGLLGMGALVVGGRPVVDRLAALLPVTRRLPAFVDGFVGAGRLLVDRPALGLLVLAQSVAVWGLTVASVWIALQSVDGLPTSVTAACVVWTVTIAGMVVLPTPGFFGAYEAFCLAALLLWGVDPDLGRTFALFLHLSSFGFTVLLGIPFLLVEGGSLRSLVDASREVQASA